MALKDIEAIADAVEPFVDRYSVRDVVEALAVVLHEKAEHIRMNWQDEGLCHAWHNGAHELTVLAGKLAKLQL